MATITVSRLVAPVGIAVRLTSITFSPPNGGPGSVLLHLGEDDTAEVAECLVNFSEGVARNYEPAGLPFNEGLYVQISGNGTTAVLHGTATRQEGGSILQLLATRALLATEP